MDEEKVKSQPSSGSSEKNISDTSLTQAPKRKSPPPPPPKPGAMPPSSPKPPKPPRPPKALHPENGAEKKESKQKSITSPSAPQNQGKKPQEAMSDNAGSDEAKADKSVENLNKTNVPGEKENETNLEITNSSDAKSSLQEEIEIAKFQCEDDDNAGAIASNENEVIEKSYKAGLSDQDRQRKKRKLRRLLLLLLLLLLLAGTVSATYFIIKNKTEYVPEYYDNVAIDVEYDFERSEDRMPGDNLILMRPIEVVVKSNTEEINYDIVAIGIRVTSKFVDTGEDCSSIIDIGFCDLSQIYHTEGDDLEYTGSNYIRCGKDIMFYYKKVLEPGQSEKLINAIRINSSTSNQYARKEISIRVEVFAVYPNPAQIRADGSEFINAPQGWVEEVYAKMTDIFKERAKKK